MKKIYCPVNGWDCPYWRRDGTCSMEKEEGVHPKDECDDYALFDEMFKEHDDDEEEEKEDGESYKRMVVRKRSRG